MAAIHESRVYRDLRIQEVVLEYQAKGYGPVYIYNHHIYPEHKISLRTFWRVLNRNPRRELKQLKNENQTVTLFG